MYIQWQFVVNVNFYVSFTLTFASQEAYQFVKDKRPAISPNLNFMGQLVAFEKQLKENQSSDDCLDIENFLPTSEQVIRVWVECMYMYILSISLSIGWTGVVCDLQEKESQCFYCMSVY